MYLQNRISIKTLKVQIRESTKCHGSGTLVDRHVKMMYPVPFAFEVCYQVAKIPYVINRTSSSQSFVWFQLYLVLFREVGNQAGDPHCGYCH
jgi:hypothetical protein